MGNTLVTHIFNSGLLHVPIIQRPSERIEANVLTRINNISRTLDTIDASITISAVVPMWGETWLDLVNSLGGGTNFNTIISNVVDDAISQGAMAGTYNVILNNVLVATVYVNITSTLGRPTGV